MSLLPTAPTCIGWGAVSALGGSARETGFMLRAGQNNFSLSPFVDNLGEPITLSSVSTFPKHLTGVARLVALASSAFEQAYAQLAPLLEGQRVRLCLALPSLYAEGRGNALTVEGQQFVAALVDRCRLPLASSQVHVLPFGGAAGAPAFTVAAQLLHEREAEAVIVCGVDSYYDFRVLDRLQQQDRLLTQDNLDGLRPGEAAACVVCVAPNHPLAKARGVSRVLATGQGHEPNGVLSEEPCMAQGFTQALREAVEPLRAQQAQTNHWVSDMTHENVRIREFQILVARFGDVMGANLLLETPARELGEVGAATLVLNAALVTEGWYRGYGTDRTALCFAGSEHGLRGALLLYAPKEGPTWA